MARPQGLYVGELTDAATHQRTGDGARPERRRLHHPRRHRRHDRLGQDRPRHRAAGGGAGARRADADPRPQGRHGQPAAHVPVAGARRLRALGARRARTPRRSPAPGRDGLADWAIDPTEIATLRTRSPHDRVHARVDGGRPAQHHRVARPARPARDPEAVDTTRSSPSCRVCSGSSASRRIRSVGPRARADGQHHRDGLGRGRDDRPADAADPHPGPADAQARRDRRRVVLPRRPTAPR